MFEKMRERMRAEAIEHEKERKREQELQDRCKHEWAHVGVHTRYLPDRHYDVSTAVCYKCGAKNQIAI